MSGTSGCRVHLPDGMGVEHFIDGILESRFGDKNLLDLIEEYEEETGSKLVDATGDDQEKLKNKYEGYGGQYWKRGNRNARLEKVLLELPPKVLQQMFPGIRSSNWLVFLQTAEYDAAGNPVMETVTEFNEFGEKVQVERPKTSIWRVEYDYYDQFGQGSRICNEKTWESIWTKMVEGLVEDLKAGGLAEAIAAAHKANAEKSPAFQTVGAKVGKDIYHQKDPDGNDSLAFDIVVTDMYNPSAAPGDLTNEFAPQLDTPEEQADDEFAPSL